MSWQDYIVDALQYDVQDFTLEDIESGIASVNYQLWESDNAAMVTSGVALQSGGIGVQVLAAGGAYEELMQLLDDVEEEARQAGCEVLTTVGRTGWKNEAKKRDFIHVASVYVKRLT